MKPINLKIKGLQSFEEEQEINFEKLSEHGLFGIFGPTGSGKSSILDAITLAIYGDIVRIKGSQADRLEHLVNINCNDMRVEFDFKIGQDLFKIIREMKFKKTERIFSSKKNLLLKNGEILADKDTGIKTEIDNIIGLSMDDFTRSVVLPQGKFSEFLKLSGTERRDMLERLFGLQKYGKQLLDKIRKKSSEYQSKIDAIDNQILGKGVVSHDELHKNEEEHKNLKTEKENKEKLLKEKNQEYKIKENIWNLQKELDFLEKQKTELLEKEKEIKIYKDNLSLDIKAKETDMFYETYSGLALKLKEKEEFSKLMEKEIKLLESGLQEENLKLTATKNSIAQLEKEKELKNLTGNLRQRAQELKNHKKDYSEKTASITEKMKYLKSIKTEIEVLNENLINLERKIESGQQQLGSLTEINESHILNKQYQIEKLELPKVKELEARLHKTEKNLADKKEEKFLLEKEINKLTEKFENLKNKQNSNYAYLLAKELKDGTPCPCCGSVNHPQVAKENNEDLVSLEKELVALEKQLTGKKISYQSLNPEKTEEEIGYIKEELGGRNSAELAEKETLYLEELKNLKELKTKYTEQKNLLETALNKLNTEKNGTKEKLSGLEAKKEFVQKETEKLDFEIEELKKQFSKMNFANNDEIDFKKIDEFLHDIKMREDFLEKSETEFKNLNKNRENSLDAIESSNKLIFAKTSGLHKNIGELQQIKIQAEETKNKLDVSMSLNSFESVEQIKKALLNNTEIEKLNFTIEEFTKNSSEVEGKIKNLREKLSDTSVTYEELHTLKELINEKGRQLENILNRLGQLSVNIKRIKDTLLEVKELLSQKAIQEKELNKYQELNKLFTGNTFIEYLALGKLRSIAYIASQRLGKISNGHYALTTNESGDFLIVDNFNNGETRRSATLSGGESFLVSLSLALALSGQIQLKSKSILEFFFLDEGFGTLDSALLDRVISSLESLRDNEKMNIGLITHVEELKERVPRKLLVTAPVSGECGTKVAIL